MYIIYIFIYYISIYIFLYIIFLYIYMPRKTRNKRKRACTRKNNYSRGKGERWNRVKRALRKKLQPDWYMSRKVRQRMRTARRAEAARDDVVARQIAEYKRDEDKRHAADDLPRMGSRFSTLRPLTPPRRLRRSPSRTLRRSVSPTPSALSRTGSHFRNTVGRHVAESIEDQLMHELSGVPLQLLQEQRLVERDGIAQHVVNTALNHLVSGVTGLPLLEPDILGDGGFGPKYRTGNSRGRGVGASVMRGKIEAQREDRELLSHFLHNELKRLEARRLKQAQMRSDIETRRKKDKTRKRKKKGKKQPKLARARSGEM